MTATEEFTIRAAQGHEYAEVGALTERAYRIDGFVDDSSDYGLELRDAASRASAAELLVAVDAAGRSVGTVTVCLPGSPYVELAEPHELEFRMLAVDRSARGRGVARRLVEAVLARARELGFGRVVLCSIDTMSTAHRLYARLGFRRYPERDWSPVPGIELLAFQLDLADVPQPG
jgi:GNAT superfamily N-acetyltransferase